MAVKDLSVITLTTPEPDTWSAGSTLTDSELNTNIRDALRFLASGGACTARLSSDQTIATTTTTNVTWGTLLDDVDGIITVPDDTFTFTRDGVVSVKFYGSFDAHVNGRRIVQLLINGTTIGRSDDSGPVTNAQEGSVILAADIPVSAGDELVCQVHQSSGASLALQSSDTQVTIVWVSKLADIVDTDAPIPTDSGGHVISKPAPSKPPSRTPTKHTKTYNAVWSRTFDGDNGVTWDDSKFCYQGRYDSNRGNTRSLVGFNWQQIKNDLSGASRISAKLGFYVNHSYSFGGLTVVIGGHGYKTKPSSWADASVDQNQQRVHANLHQRKTVSLTSHLANGFQTGKYKGIAFGPGPSTSLSYYGFFNGVTQSSKPSITFTYYK
jgi:hypothetical protein